MVPTATRQPAYPTAPPAQAGTVTWEGASNGVSNVQDLGFTVLLCFLFMIFSRIFDMYLTGFHIPGTAERLMAVVVVVTGAFWRPFQTNIGKRLLWFTAWAVMGIPFSVWRGSSFNMLFTGWWSPVLVFVAAGGLISNFQQYRRSAFTLAIAIFVLSLFCLHFGTLESGRLWMANRSRFANPNEMAQAMLIGIPFWLATAKRSASAPTKLVAFCILLVMVYIIAKTGSRGALISFAVLYLVVVYHASAIGKAGLLLAAGLSMCAALAFLPSSLKDRYKTLFSEDKLATADVSEQSMLISAETSTESREHLLRQSLILTATHPIFGVGFGQFQVAENALAISQGHKKGSWLGTHNSYMQVASETGLIGAFFFISMLFLSLKTCYSVYRATKDNPDYKDISTQAEGLFLSLLCLAVSDLFIHVAYTMLLPVLAGMTVSLEYTTRPLLAEMRRKRAVAAGVLPPTIITRSFTAPNTIRRHAKA